MGAKYVYCQFGHPRPQYMADCPTCGSATKSSPIAKKQLALRDGVTESEPERDGVTAIHCPSCRCEKEKLHETNAERQAAYRERSK